MSSTFWVILKINKEMKKGIRYIILLLGFSAFAQVEMKIDTSKIRIGEQIQYELSIDEQPQVSFPKLELDSLGKIEILHQTPVDTIRKRLYKKYYLTGFDSGAFRIPAQKIKVGQQIFLSDSLLIEVNTVAVDTTKQGLFPIKHIYKAKPKDWKDYLVHLWWLLVLLPIAGLVWWWHSFRKKQNKKKQVVLKPIEEALEHFESLDEKDLVTQEKIKEYYIELTDIVRDYIGKDVDIPTLEVTTDELISLLEIHNKSKKLGIEKERIKTLHEFLKHADLVKFAKAKPEQEQIHQDRETAESVVNAINEVVNKPILDEFGNEIIPISQEEIAEQNKKKKRNKILLISGVVVLGLILGLVSIFGYRNVKDTLLGHPSKELLEGKWYQSSYGYPAVSLETPAVLKPEKSSDELSVFSYGSLLEDFHIYISTAKNQSEMPITQEMVVTSSIQAIETQEGVTDFTYDEEAYTIDGVDGVKVTGHFTIKNVKHKFYAYIFVEDEAIRMLIIEMKDKDIYAEDIYKRIEKSIQLLKIEEDDE